MFHGHLPNPSAARRRGAVSLPVLAAFTVVASEWLPVSLLTPIATHLHISEGAGQAIAIRGIRARDQPVHLIAPPAA